MSPKPKVSVIVPVYNAEEYLEDCISSIVHQTLQDIEIICVNDGSTDNSINILNRFSQYDKRIKIINQENAGAGAARNNGVKIAQGEYIGFIDSDDYIELDMYDTMYRRAISDDSDLVIDGSVFIPKDTIHFFTDASTMYLMENKPFSASKYPVILNSCFVWNRIYKTGFYNKYHFTIPENRKFAEDLLFCTQTSVLASKISLISKPLYHYNIRDNSLTRVLEKSLDKSDFIMAIKETKEFLEKQMLYNIYNETFLIFVMNIAFPLLCRMNKYKYAKEFFSALHSVLNDEDFSTLKAIDYGNKSEAFKAFSQRQWSKFWIKRGI